MRKRIDPNKAIVQAEQPRDTMQPQLDESSEMDKDREFGEPSDSRVDQQHDRMLFQPFKPPAVELTQFIPPSVQRRSQSDTDQSLGKPCKSEQNRATIKAVDATTITSPKAYITASLDTSHQDTCNCFELLLFDDQINSKLTSQEILSSCDFNRRCLDVYSCNQENFCYKEMAYRHIETVRTAMSDVELERIYMNQRHLFKRVHDCREWQECIKFLAKIRAQKGGYVLLYPPKRKFLEAFGYTWSGDEHSSSQETSESKEKPNIDPKLPSADIMSNQDERDPMGANERTSSDARSPKQTLTVRYGPQETINQANSNVVTLHDQIPETSSSKRESKLDIVRASKLSCQLDEEQLKAILEVIEAKFAERLASRGTKDTKQNHPDPDPESSCRPASLSLSPKKEEQDNRSHALDHRARHSDTYNPDCTLSGEYSANYEQTRPSKATTEHSPSSDMQESDDEYREMREFEELHGPGSYEFVTGRATQTVRRQMQTPSTANYLDPLGFTSTPDLPAKIPVSMREIDDDGDEEASSLVSQTELDAAIHTKTIATSKNRSKLDPALSRYMAMLREQKPTDGSSKSLEVSTISPLLGSTSLNASADVQQTETINSSCPPIAELSPIAKSRSSCLKSSSAIGSVAPSVTLRKTSQVSKRSTKKAAARTSRSEPLPIDLSSSTQHQSKQLATTRNTQSGRVVSVASRRGPRMDLSDIGINRALAERFEGHIDKKKPKPRLVFKMKWIGLANPSDVEVDEALNYPDLLTDYLKALSSTNAKALDSILVRYPQLQVYLRE